MSLICESLLFGVESLSLIILVESVVKDRFAQLFLLAAARYGLAKFKLIEKTSKPLLECSPSLHIYLEECGMLSKHAVQDVDMLIIRN